MTGMNVLAKAIFDNFAESGDELEFHRGDVVTVIEQNTAGLEGWWLCSFHGKQGIAPGNRLRLLPGMFDNKQIEPDQDVYDVPPSHQWNSPQHQVDDDQDEEYDIPRRQPQITAGGYMPQSPTEIYDVPRASPFHQVSDDGEIYDIPTSAIAAQTRVFHPEDDQEVYNVPSNLMAMSQTPDPMEVYDVPPLVSRGPAQNEFHPEEVYDVPPRRPDVTSADLIDVQHPEEVYDVPPSVAKGGPRVNFAQSRSSPSRQESTDSDVVYDIPQSIRTRNIPSGLNSLRRMRREINALSTASTSEATTQRDQQPSQVDYIYDVPPQVSRDSSRQAAKDDEVVNGLLKRLSMNNDLDDKRSNRLSTMSKDSFSSYIDDNPLQYSELRMDLNSALERLIELKKNLEDTVSKLLTMVKKNWRQRENLTGKVSDIQKNFVDVLVAVTHFIAFARGATGNAFAVGEHGEEGGAPKNVKAGLRKLLVPVEEDAEMLKRALAELDEGGWDIEKLVLEDGMDDGVALDEVDSFVMSSRAVSDDAAQMAVFVHTHAHHIFKKSIEVQPEAATSGVTTSPERERPAHEIHALQARPLPSVPKTSATTNFTAPTTTMPGEDAWLEDYDYVALEDKDETDKLMGTPDSLSGLNKRRTQMLALDKELSPTIIKSETSKLSPKERIALNSLAIDIPDLMHCLSNSIEQFTNAVEKGNQPHTFVALSKQVILSAHKLVFVGDCVHQHVDIPTVKNAIQSHCSDMCTTLKHTVMSTKLAALQWPAVGAVQDMMDKMYDIAKCAHQIRLTLNNILY